MDESGKFENLEDYGSWIAGQQWYQTITLESGLVTPGTVKTDLRAPKLSSLDYRGKSVLDVGCNSGQYCLMAKKLGAHRVVGIDPDSLRINQARVLAINEGLEIDFRVGTLESLVSLGKFDIVFCIAVLTEVTDVLGSLSLLRRVTGDYSFIELGLSRPVLHLSLNSRWWRRETGISRVSRSLDVIRHKHVGWVVYPTLELVKDIWGTDFCVSHLGRGVRYDMLEIRRVPS